MCKRAHRSYLFRCYDVGVIALRSWNNEFVYRVFRLIKVYNTIIRGYFVYNKYIIHHANEVYVRTVLLVRTLTLIHAYIDQSFSRTIETESHAIFVFIYNATRFIRQNRATTNAVCSVHMPELLCRPLKCNVWCRTAKGRLSRFRQSSSHGSRT